MDKDRGRGQQVNLQVCVQGRLAPEIFKQKKVLTMTVVKLL